MSTKTVQGTRLESILECLANPDRDFVARLGDSPSYWQAVRVNELMTIWVETAFAKKFDATLAWFQTRVPLSLEDNTALNKASVAVWDHNAAVFYREGVLFGQQVAAISPATRFAIGQAMAFLDNDSRDWAAIVQVAATENLWVQAAFGVAAARYVSLGSMGKPGDAWDNLLEKLEAHYSIDSEIIRTLDEDLIISTDHLRDYIFDQGRLDGEVLNGGGAQ